MVTVYLATNLVNGNTYFDSGKAAAIALGLNAASISKVCLEKRKQLNGLHFIFV